MVPFHILDDLDAGFLFTQLPFLSGHGLFGFFQTSRKLIKTGFGSRALFLDTLLLVFASVRAVLPFARRSAALFTSSSARSIFPSSGPGGDGAVLLPDGRR